MRESWNCDRVLKWVEAIVQERWGCAFRMSCLPAGVVLTLRGVTGSIAFDRLRRWPSGCCTELPIAWWTANREGWTSVLGKPLPAPGAASLPSPLIEKAVDGYCIHYDIFGLAYWMLTRQEEIGRTDLDEHGRFSSTSSHASKHGYLERPIVDEWLDVLQQVIQRTWSSVTLKQQAFSIKVSHDVDQPTRYGFRPWRSLPRGMATDLLKRRDMRGLFAPWVKLNTHQRLHPADPFNTFNWLMDVSERHGLVSAFYFICDRCGTAYDSDYDLGHPAIRDLIRRICARGHEIGLHSSYNTYLNPVQIKREADRLWWVCKQEGVRQNEWGGRMHYLQWRQPITPRAWNDAGLAYDNTLTYADHAGFRCGTCFEYPAFDPVVEEPLRLRIRPLVVMEDSVFGDKYMNLGVTDAALDKMLQLKRTCEAVGGCFTLLWHNSSLQMCVDKSMYESVLSS